MSSRKLTSLKQLSDAVDYLKVLAHPHRLRMCQMLLQGKYCVGQLAEACGISVPMTSEHLRLMQHASLLTSEKDGRHVYYHPSDSYVESLIRCIEDHYGCNGESESLN